MTLQKVGGRTMCYHLLPLSFWADGLYQQQQPPTTGVRHHNRRTTWISRGLLERASAAMPLTHVRR